MTAIVRGRLRDHRWVDEQPVYVPAAALYGPPNYHYGSRFLFDRDGKLLYSIGDRGLPAFRPGSGQPAGQGAPRQRRRHRPRGATRSPDAPAHVPTIWTYGYRNPQGFSIDPVSGLLWESEHGPMGGDELNIVEAGHNFMDGP